MTPYPLAWPEGMPRSKMRELEEHWPALKSGLAHHIALGRLPEGV